MSGCFHFSRDTLQKALESSSSSSSSSSSIPWRLRMVEPGSHLGRKVLLFPEDEDDDEDDTRLASSLRS